MALNPGQFPKYTPAPNGLPMRAPAPDYPRTLANHGMDADAVLDLVSAMMGRNRSQVTTGMAFARPVTGTHPLAAGIVHALSEQLKPNLPLTFAYEGVWEMVEAAGDLILGLMNHPVPEQGGMVVMKSATQSLQQALYLMLTQYYGSHGVDLKQVGYAGAAALDIPRPAILAAVNSNMMLSKAAPLIGIGRQDIYFYDLDDHFQACVKSVAAAVDRAHAAGRRIVAHLAMAGDAEHGISHRVRELDSLVSEKCGAYRYRPPVVVDAAAQWLNLLMSGRSEQWDLRTQNENVVAVIVDPQKTEMPYDLSLLLLRDFTALKAFTDGHFLAEPSKRALLSQAPPILSRGGEPIIAAYGYLLNQGLHGLQQSRSRILEHVKRFAQYVRNSEHYHLIAEPEGSVVSFRHVSTDQGANWRVVEGINVQESDRLLITHTPQARVRTREDLERSLRGDRSLDGLVVHMMEHNTDKALELLMRRLDEVGLNVSTVE